MFLLISLLSLAKCLLLPHDFKQISRDNSYKLGEGKYGTVSLTSIGPELFALKKQQHFQYPLYFSLFRKSFIENSATELAVMLFAASQRTDHVISASFASFTNQETFIGMPLMVGDMNRVVSFNGDNLLDKQAKCPVSEQMMLDVLLGVADMHRMGIVHYDLELRNVLIDANCKGYLSDFGTSNFTEPAYQESAKEYALTCSNYRLLRRDYGLFGINFSKLVRLMEINGVALKFDWQSIFNVLSQDCENQKTFVWVAEQIKQGGFRLS